MSAIKQFIPAGTEVVIRRNGSEFWHTTSKDVPVNGGVTVENCPVREIEVLTMVYMNYQIWFLESQVNVELTDEQKNAAKSLELAFLDYDVPAVVSRRPGFEHPSGYLWRWAVRTSLSCWVIPHRAVPWARLRELTRNGCNWRVTRIDVSEAPKILQEAIAALQSERADAYRRAEASKQRAEERVNNGQGDINTRLARRRADLKRIEKTLAQDLQNVADGAKALGIPMQWIEANSVRSLTRAITATSVQRAEDAGNVVDRANALGTQEGKNVAKMVLNNEMPDDIAKDYVEDNETFSLVNDDDKE